jgi:hypothetical protein
VQGGLLVNLFSWKVTSDSIKKVTLSDEKQADLDDLIGPTSIYDQDVKNTTFEFNYPNVSLALGLTFNFGTSAALDLAFIKYANPTADGMIYKAIGDGFLSDETSLVFSLKF